MYGTFPGGTHFPVVQGRPPEKSRSVAVARGAIISRLRRPSPGASLAQGV